MIDYDKLMNAFKNAERENIDVNFAYHKDDTWFHWVSVEQFILDMQEQTKPEPKYKIGTEVFVLMGDEVRSFEIHDIIDDGEYWYLHYISHHGSEFDQYGEDILFPTRQALIEHQLQYWQSLSEPVEKVEQSQYVPDCLPKCQHIIDTDNRMCMTCHRYVPYCEHESDGYTYITNHRPQQYSKKCIKCGEFYR